MFADFCWQIVRTTNTGGVKLIYNGIPNNGTCNNAKEAQTIGKSTFNDDWYSPGFVGYMYNKTYERTFFNYTDMKDGYLYGNSFTYDESSNTYKLKDTISFNEIEKVLSPLNEKQSLLEQIIDKSLKYYDYYENNENKTFLWNDIERLMSELPDLNKKIGTTKEEITTIFYEYTDSISKINEIIDILNRQEELTPKIKNDTNTNEEKGEMVKEISTLNEKIDKIKDNLTSWEIKYKELNNYHYTCLNKTGQCQNLYYIYYGDNMGGYYVTLDNGKSINDALDEMLYNNDVNTNNSVIKEKIDNWYKNNMIEYTKNLEDTVFCNDRRPLNLNGWNPNGGDLSDIIYYYSWNKQDLTCQNKEDRFTMNTSLGNGKLKYPVGLLTTGEINLSTKDSSSFIAQSNYWVMSPSNTDIYAAVDLIEDGTSTSRYVGEENSIRPSVSLKQDIEYISGDGSTNNPFTLKIEE